MCQIDVLYGKSLIIDFLDDFLKKRTAIENTPWKMRTKKTILTIPRENVTFCMSLPTSWSSLVLTFEWRRERLNQELGNCVVVRKKKYKMKYSCKKNFFVMSRQHHQSALFLQKKFCCWNMRQILYDCIVNNEKRK